MTEKVEVRIINRWFMEPDPGYYGIQIETIKLWWVCSKCGAPRGKLRTINQPEDGAYYNVHVWDNPCGHVDNYRDVWEEARAQSKASV